MAVRHMLIAGRYRLHEPVGTGGMGRVWLARDEMLDRDVAVKEFVPPEWMTDGEKSRLRDRTLREARSAARLNHPHVVRIYDVVHADDLPWIVMEYVPSRSLHQVVLEDGPFSPVATARIGLAVLDALSAAHSAGVLHRDVKPHNVLIGNDGRVVLTDFGLATFVDDGSVTTPGLVVGSPQYVSPERARDGASTVESDLWSLGATLYAAVEGRSPYARESAMATLMALASEKPDPTVLAGPLAPVLHGLLRREPTDRLTAGEVRDGLRAVVVDGPPRVLPRSRYRNASGRAVVPAPRRPRDDRAPERPGTTAAPGGGVPGGAGGAVPGGVGGGVPGGAGGAVGRAGAGPNSAPAAAGGAVERAGAGAGPVRGRGADARGAPAAEPAGVVAVGIVRSPAMPGQGDPGSAGPDRGSPPDTLSTTTGRTSVAQTIRRALHAPAGAGDHAARTAAPVSPAPRTGNGSLPARPSSASPSGVPADEEPAGPVRTPRRSRARLAVAGTVAALLAVGGAGDVVWQHRHDRETPALPVISAPAARSGPDRDTFSPSVCGTSPAPGLPRTPQRGAARGVNGWVLLDDYTYFADRSRFHVAVPDGWTYEWIGTTLCFRDPANIRFLSVDPERDPAGDPVKACRAEAKRLRDEGELPHYQEIGVEPVPLLDRAADWEYTYTAPGNVRMHAMTRWFAVDGKAYALGWATREFDWQGNRSTFAMIEGSFYGTTPPGGRATPSPSATR
jgi:eukaryotic-like serine/threonine-protein kinase